MEYGCSTYISGVMLLEQTGDAKGLLGRRNMFCQKHVARNDSLRFFFPMHLIPVMRGAVTIQGRS